jgi:hypothetical protein
MSAEELFLEMGRTLTPRSTSALMTLLQIGENIYDRLMHVIPVPSRRCCR